MSSIEIQCSAPCRWSRVAYTRRPAPWAPGPDRASVAYNRPLSPDAAVQTELLQLTATAPRLLTQQFRLSFRCKQPPLAQPTDTAVQTELQQLTAFTPALRFLTKQFRQSFSSLQLPPRAPPPDAAVQPALRGSASWPRTASPWNQCTFMNIEQRLILTLHLRIVNIDWK